MGRIINSDFNSQRPEFGLSSYSFRLRAPAPRYAIVARSSAITLAALMV